MGSTNVTATLVRERRLDQVILQGPFSNEDGDLDLGVLLPAGLGDVAILEASIDASQIATLVANPELLGLRWFISAADGTLGDILGTTRWTRVFSNRLSSYVSPDPLVLWKQGERLKVLSLEIDTNAAPTVDVDIFVKAVRLREDAPKPLAPLRFVR